MSCCQPAGLGVAAAVQAPPSAGAARPRWKMLDIAGGTFRMGTDAAGEGFVEDGEGPSRDA